MRLAIRENMVPGATLEEKLACLKSVGYEAIELTSQDALGREPRALAETCRSAGVAVATVTASFDLLNPDPAVRATAMAFSRAQIELAAVLGRPFVLVVPIFGKPLVPNLSPVRTAVELETELLVAELRDLARVAEPFGVTLMLEPLNRYETHLVNRLEQGVSICEAVGSENVQIMADFFHMEIEEADIPTSIRSAGRHVVYVHVADSNRKQPGRGHLDLRPGFAALKSVGYDGYLGVECGLLGDPKAALAEAAGNVRRAWNEA
jgi:sugar phosphate isomerase/epimerase